MYQRQSPHPYTTDPIDGQPRLGVKWTNLYDQSSLTDADLDPSSRDITDPLRSLEELKLAEQRNQSALYGRDSTISKSDGSLSMSSLGPGNRGRDNLLNESQNARTEYLKQAGLPVVDEESMRLSNSFQTDPRQGSSNALPGRHSFDPSTLSSSSKPNQTFNMNPMSTVEESNKENQNEDIDVDKLIAKIDSFVTDRSKFDSLMQGMSEKLQTKISDTDKSMSPIQRHSTSTMIDGTTIEGHATFSPSKGENTFESTRILPSFEEQIRSIPTRYGEKKEPESLYPKKTNIIPSNQNISEGRPIDEKYRELRAAMLPKTGGEIDPFRPEFELQGSSPLDKRYGNAQSQLSEQMLAVGGAGRPPIDKRYAYAQDPRRIAADSNRQTGSQGTRNRSESPNYWVNQDYNTDRPHGGDQFGRFPSNHSSPQRFVDQSFQEAASVGGFSSMERPVQRRFNAQEYYEKMLKEGKTRGRESNGYANAEMNDPRGGFGAAMPNRQFKRSSSLHGLHQDNQSHAQNPHYGQFSAGGGENATLQDVSFTAEPQFGNFNPDNKHHHHHQQQQQRRRRPRSASSRDIRSHYPPELSNLGQDLNAPLSTRSHKSMNFPEFHSGNSTPSANFASGSSNRMSPLNYFDPNHPIFSNAATGGGNVGGNVMAGNVGMGGNPGALGHHQSQLGHFSSYSQDQYHHHHQTHQQHQEHVLENTTKQGYAGSYSLASGARSAGYMDVRSRYRQMMREAEQTNGGGYGMQGYGGGYGYGYQHEG
eukprot:CAMPEP_0115023506 /NCGR_PEP_ID=MMETSP0216-20121206/32444_1 /TAXON_ID=223996 /ORGANISM="Protocruzia adherens, Strain Boccale" /LENGTH=760 /DNA_ID=CAMNT_0002396909 /DNA_START=72 /DNA_END=2350 /DNA_ORIENTATION=-